MIIVVSPVRAGTVTWDGGGTDSNWQTAANWSGDAAPGGDGSETLAFSGGTRTSAANNYSADTAFAGLFFLNDGTSGKTAAFTLSGNQITLSGNIVSTTASSSSTVTDIISLPILLSGTRTFTLNTYHHLTVSSVIGETGGSYGLVKGGGGNLTLNGANTYSGATVMSGGQVYFNSIKNIGEGASSFGAPTTLESGTITNSSRLSYTGSSATTDRPLVLTGGIQFDVSSGSSTLTMNGDITSANNSGVTFRGGGNFVINGMIGLGTASAGRTDGGTVYLNCPTNPFTGNIQISAGAFSISNIANSGAVSAIGKGSTITLGQHGWGTSGKLQFTGPYGGSCNRTIYIETTPGTTAYGGLIENTVAGQMLLLSGTVAPGSASATNQPRLQLIGAGNGELSGVISGSIKIEKNSGTGTWTLSGANTYTGATVVSAGKLFVNGSTRAGSAVSVASGGTLGGTGTVYGAVSVAAGGTLAPGVDGIGTLTLDSAALTLGGGTFAAELGAEAGTCDRVDMAGELVLNGANAIALTVGSAPAGIYTLMTYASHSGTGTLTLDTTNPRYRLTVGETAVTLTIGGDTLVWRGDAAANVWDTTTANWLDGDTPATYVDGLAVVFDNGGSAAPALSISPDAVAPFSVTVDADTNAYTIGGAAIIGACDLTKTGTNSLTLTGANTYGGATAVNAGTLALSGSLSNSSVTVANGATFTESAGAVIAGADVSLISYGTTTLSGTNTYDGVTTVGVLGTPNIILTINNNQALGSTAAGTILNGGNASTENRLVLGNGVTVTNETLTLNTGSATCRAGLHYAQYSGSATWAGDIVLAGSSYAYIGGDNAGGTLIVGASFDNNTITGTVASFSVRGSGNVIINSRLDLGTTSVNRDDPGIWTLNSSGNAWQDTFLAQGTLKLGVSDALPTGTTLNVGKSGNTAAAIFDLNGLDQRVAGLADLHYAAGTGTQRILSGLPATLTVSNNAACSYGKTGSSIEGAVSLVKTGSDALTLTSTTSYSGATVVSNGTLVVSATGTLGDSTNVVVAAGTLTLQGSETVTDSAIVWIADGGGAKISLADGVNEAVGRLFFGDKQKGAGVYGATGSGATIINDEHFTGSGVLTVKHGNSGAVLLLR